MKIIFLLFLTLWTLPIHVVFGAETAQNLHGTWRIDEVKAVRTEPPANQMQAQPFIGKTLSIQTDEIRYGDKFLWFDGPCRKPHYQIEDYKKPQNDPTKESDYGLPPGKRIQKEFTVSCLWSDGKRKPTFSFEIISADQISIYWDGSLVFLRKISGDESAESKYLKASRAILDRFKTHEPSDEENRAALKELDGLIQEAVGPIQIKGFQGKWTSNLLTFQNEVGYGRADGVTADVPGLTAFVSTPKLLSAYLASKDLDLKTASENEKLLSATLASDASLTPFFDVPVERPQAVTQARALVGLEAQDIGPFEPHELVVVAHRGNQVFLMREHLNEIKTQIPACAEIWMRQQKLAETAYAKYKSSNLQDQKALNEHHHLEDQAFKSYLKCFRKSAKAQAFFPEIKRRAAVLLKRLE
ncbi:MAG: hypothetical protein ACJ763_16350 [Bdellovibrionia bacterium]